MTRACPGSQRDRRKARGPQAVAIHAPGNLGDPKRFKETYWSEVRGATSPVTAAGRTRTGYFWIMGRIDDVLNVAGHRIGTAEIESALVSHPSVAEAAAVGRPDDLKGQALVCFVTLKSGRTASADLKNESRNHIGKEIGPVAKPDEIRFADALPKTRSGKIMRRLLKQVASGMEIRGDTTTLEDLSVRRSWPLRRISLRAVGHPFSSAVVGESSGTRSGRIRLHPRRTTAGRGSLGRDRALLIGPRRVPGADCSRIPRPLSNDAPANESLQLAQAILIFGSDETDGVSDRLGPPRTTDAVHIVLDVHGEVVVDHMGYAVHIDASCRDVGWNQHPDRAGLEVGKGAQALALERFECSVAVGIPCCSKRRAIRSAPCFMREKTMNHVETGILQEMEQQGRF